MVHRIGVKNPMVHDAAFIAWNAEVAGDVRLGKDTGVWFGASIRGDMAPINIGTGTNIQDNASLHVDSGVPLSIGDGVTVGHGAILHGCTIEDDCLIGMGAIVLNNVTIGKESIVGAGALITEGKSFPPRSIIVGSPAKAVKTVSEEQCKAIHENRDAYIQLAREAESSYKAEP